MTSRNTADHKAPTRIIPRPAAPGRGAAGNGRPETNGHVQEPPAPTAAPAPPAKLPPPPERREVRRLAGESEEECRHRRREEERRFRKAKRLWMEEAFDVITWSRDECPEEARQLQTAFEEECDRLSRPGRKPQRPPAGEAGADPAHTARDVDTGGILHLPDALARYPALGIVLYNRVSSWEQAGRGKVKLTAKTDAVMREVRRLAPGRLRRIVRGAVEEGKLSGPRPYLEDAGKYARKRGAILVAPDLSRFLRAEDYDRRTNRNVWPTAEEFRRLHELTGGVVLAVVAPPYLSEDERQSLATKRTAKAGRPRAIDDELAAKIFADLGYLCFSTYAPGGRWERPLREVADEYGVSASTISRYSKRVSPDGRTWRKRAIDEAVRRGLMRYGENEEELIPLR